MSTIDAKEKKSRKPILIAVIAVVVVLAVGLVAAFGTGVLSPAGAAAKYGFFKYVDESETTEYIETYKTQMGYGEASDAEWATFLAAYNLTPERLRASTIDQLLTDKIVEERCAKLGIKVTDEELAQAVDSYKQSYAYGSDELWEQTLQEHGQTQQGFEDGIRLTLLKEKLCEDQVETPTPTDDEVRTTLASFVSNAVANDKSLTLKHSYCFKKAKSSSEGSIEERDEVEKIRKGLIGVGASTESFASVVDLYCDDESLKKTSGANGWDADTSGYSDEYVKALASVDEGDVSAVYADDDCYFFIWVSDTYKLPKTAEKAEKVDLDEMPEALHQYFSDVAAYALWQTAAQDYLTGITSDVKVTYYPMPSDVSYNVDMSLATSTEEEEEK